MRGRPAGDLLIVFALSGAPLTNALPSSNTMSSASASSMCAAIRRAFALIFWRLL